MSNSKDECSLVESMHFDEVGSYYKNAISKIHPTLLQLWLYYQLKKCENIREFEQKA